MPSSCHLAIAKATGDAVDRVFPADLLASVRVTSDECLVTLPTNEETA